MDDIQSSVAAGSAGTNGGSAESSG
jgi:hypothetical protein